MYTALWIVSQRLAEVQFTVNMHFDRTYLQCMEDSFWTPLSKNLVCAAIIRLALRNKWMVDSHSYSSKRFWGCKTSIRQQIFHSWFLGLNFVADFCTSESSKNQPSLKMQVVKLSESDSREYSHGLHLRLSRAGLLYRVQKKVPYQLLVWGIGYLWRTWMIQNGL